MDQKIIIKSTLIVLILSLMGLFILLNQSNRVVNPGMYYIECNNGSLVTFNQSDILVCNGPNPLQVPRVKKYESDVFK